MDSKQKNILHASIKVVVAAIATFLAWVGGVLAWVINNFSGTPEPDDTPDAHVVIEGGFLKAKGGDFEGIMEILDDPRNKE